MIRRELTIAQQFYGEDQNNRIHNPMWFVWQVKHTVLEWREHRAKAVDDHEIDFYYDINTLLSYLQLYIEEYEGLHRVDE